MNVDERTHVDVQDRVEIVEPAVRVGGDVCIEGKEGGDVRRGRFSARTVRGAALAVDRLAAQEEVCREKQRETPV